MSVGSFLLVACGKGNTDSGAGGAGGIGGATGQGGAVASGGASAGAGACAPATDPESLRVPVRLPDVLPTPRVAVDDLKGMHRGFNFGNALDAPNEGDWGVTITEKFFEIAVEAGFDHVRVPVRFSAHAETVAPYAIDEALLTRVDWVLDQAEANGLGVVLDMHYEEQLFADPPAEEPRFIAMWQQIATRYAARPKSLKLELSNEPNGKLDDYWNYIFPRALSAVRAIDAERTVIIDATGWSWSGNLDDLRIVDDPHWVASFHTYDPFPFTHQGAFWLDAEMKTRCVVFPGPPQTPLIPVEAALNVNWLSEWFDGYNNLPAEQNPGSAAVVEETFGYVDRFIENTGVPVYLGEFAAIDGADPASRERWVRLVREHAEARGIPWSYWTDGNAMRAFDRVTGEWLPNMRRALLDKAE
ncbi:MAG: glycoside hydrolase family 5 protein [Polyangiaceae bacterium]